MVPSVSAQKRGPAGRVLPWAEAVVSCATCAMGLGQFRSTPQGAGGLYHRPSGSNMPSQDKFHLRSVRATSGTTLSRNISVLFSEKPQARVEIAVGNLKQASRPAAALVNDPVALRQGEDVAPVPSNDLASNLTFA